MASDNRLLWLVFAGLVALIAVPLALWRLGESRRPVLEEVRVVTASGGDPVFRSGLRRVGPSDEVTIAAALRIRRADGSDVWLAPVDELVIDGTAVDHLPSDRWPDRDRVLRVFWFTIESSYLGGDLTAASSEKLLTQRGFLAPEMGRGLLAKTVPEQHNDDQINLGDEVVDIGGGTVRLYAKVEVAEKADAIASEQAVSSPGADRIGEPGFTEIRMASVVPEPLSPVLGELFRLPGFEPQPDADGDWNETTRGSHGATFSELVERRLVVSSWTFASVALTAGVDLDREAFAELGRIALDGDRPLRRGRPLSWGSDVVAGDVLEDRGQFIVLVADDGDGLLGSADRVAVCWRRPAVVTTLDQATRDDAVEAGLLRHGG
jgi:hypothetical protein